MSAQYSPDECARLIAEAREDDDRMTRAPWEWFDGKYLWCYDADQGVLQHGGVQWPMSEANKAGIARTRNNLRAVADQLEAAQAEIARLTSRLALESAALEQACNADIHNPITVAEAVDRAVAAYLGRRDKLQAELEAARRERDEAKSFAAEYSKQMNKTREMCDREHKVATEKLRSDRALMRPVVESAAHWREMRYPQARSWKADCDEDMHLVSAVDTYRAARDKAVAPDALIDAMVDAAAVDYVESDLLARLMRPVLTDLAVWLTRGDAADLPRRTGLSKAQVDRAMERMRAARDKAGE